MSTIPLFPINPKIDLTNVAVVENQFNETELDKISSILDNLNYEEGKILSSEKNGDINTDIRKSKIKWIYSNEETLWLFIKLMKIIHSVNSNAWNFDLIMGREPIQYTEYGTEGEYTWHIDNGPGISSQRKISISMLLSDPEDYEGGDLEIWPGGEIKVMPRIKNSIVIFPSCLMHRVTPITKGIRKSLVLWVGGTPYK